MTSDVLKQIWPEWEIEEKPLGKGSFGMVYKAVRSDYNVKSYAAIKVISIPSDPSEVDSLRSEGLDINATKTFLRGIVDDFVNEIQLMESLKGVQNIVSVEDYKVVEKTDEIGWDIFIRMELLTTFNAYTCDKKLTEEEVIKLGCDICSALEICSKRNIVHRDIKPENIFINDFGYFKLGDFGIARKLENLTGGLSQKGTFNYMAPEVATGNDYDSRVDTYSLGIVLYRLLNGNRLPFLDTEKQLLNPHERKNAVDRRLRGEALPAPRDASPAMADVILRACAHNPNLRFSSAAEMKQALMSVANGAYQATGAVDLDCTINIHRTPAVSGQQADQSVNTAAEAGDPNGTISIRKAPDASNQQAGQKVSTFGPAPDGDAIKRKKLKMIISIASSACAACAVLVLTIILLPKVINRPASNIAGDDVSSSSEERVTSVSSIADDDVSSSLEGSVIPVSSSTTLSSSSVPSSSSTMTTTSSPSKSSSSSESTSGSMTVIHEKPVEATVSILGKEYDISTTTHFAYTGDQSINNDLVKQVCELKNLRTLELGNPNFDNDITDISGIEKLKGLEELTINSTHVQNITPLSKLTNLTYLDLQDNQIRDITPLVGLTNLNELRLAHNQISDITPLAKLTELENLNLGYNQISDITPLASLKKLTHLILAYNSISDIAPLANFTALTRLDMSKNAVSNITSLSNLTKLTGLQLSYNKISNISPLADLKNLEYLWIISNEISDITPLANLTNLKGLWSNRNQISNITPLANLKNVEILYISLNQISDITPLSNLFNLKELAISDNQIKDITPLEENTSLEMVYVGYNQISEDDINHFQILLPNCDVYERDNAYTSWMGWS